MVHFTTCVLRTYWYDVLVFSIWWILLMILIMCTSGKKIKERVGVGSTSVGCVSCCTIIILHRTRYYMLSYLRTYNTTIPLKRTVLPTVQSILHAVSIGSCHLLTFSSWIMPINGNSALGFGCAFHQGSARFLCLHHVLCGGRGSDDFWAVSSCRGFRN